ncbi:MAG: xylose isomerase [Brevinema sp.]
MALFKDVDTVQYEGSNSRNPYAFKHYHADQKIADKTMKEWLPFSMTWWHTLSAGGRDPFGVETANRPWNNLSPMQASEMRVEAGFEFMEKLGINYFCFHDRDIAPEGENLLESNKYFDHISELIAEQMKRTNKKLLWGTASLFTNPIYMHGAATSPNADVFAMACAQTKKALEITHKLDGQGYVFWGGREGYETLLNTDIKKEQDHLAYFLQMAIDYKEKIGFKGKFFLEPKPKEPTKHQYDFDVSTCLEFLHKYQLENYFTINIEVNHATLSGHTVHHEINLARINNMWGSMDINFGDPLLGWDTDQFPTNIYDATLIMYELIQQKGFTHGGLNFDAKVRRGSHTMNDLVASYIAGMDTLAWGLKAADLMIKDGYFANNIKNRYNSYQSGIGAKIDTQQVSFEELENYALNLNKIVLESGKQEILEAELNQFIWNSAR